MYLVGINLITGVDFTHFVFFARFENLPVTHGEKATFFRFTKRHFQQILSSATKYRPFKLIKLSWHKNFLHITVPFKGEFLSCNNWPCRLNKHSTWIIKASKYSWSSKPLDFRVIWNFLNQQPCEQKKWHAAVYGKDIISYQSRRVLTNHKVRDSHVQLTITKGNQDFCHASPIDFFETIEFHVPQKKPQEFNRIEEIGLPRP